MISEDKKVWGVHTQDDYLFLHKDVIAIGWKDFGDLKAIENTREAFKEHYAAVYPQSKKQAIANSAGMLYRFIYEVQAGDYIVFPSKSDRKINIGVVDGEYEYVPSAPEYVQQRKVRWIKHLREPCSHKVHYMSPDLSCLCFSLKITLMSLLQRLTITLRRILRIQKMRQSAQLPRI